MERVAFKAGNKESRERKKKIRVLDKPRRDEANPLILRKEPLGQTSSLCSSGGTKVKSRFLRSSALGAYWMRGWTA